jgi:hypothetical protein
MGSDGVMYYYLQDILIGDSDEKRYNDDDFCNVPWTFWSPVLLV